MIRGAFRLLDRSGNPTTFAALAALSDDYYARWGPEGKPPPVQALPRRRPLSARCMTGRHRQCMGFIDHTRAKNCPCECHGGRA